MGTEKNFEKEIGAKLLDVIPRLQNRIQLTGLLVVVALIALIYSISPDNLLAQVIAGLMGGVIIIFPLAFNFLGHIPKEDRAIMVTRMFFAFIFTIVFLGIVTTLIILNSNTVSTARIEERAVAKLESLDASLAREISQRVKLANRAYSLGKPAQWRSINSEISALSDRRESVLRLLADKEKYSKDLVGLYRSLEDFDDQNIDGLQLSKNMSLTEISDNARRLADLELETAGELRYLSGRAAELSGDFQLAKDQYSQARALSPSNLTYAISLGQILEKLGDFGGAQETLLVLQTDANVLGPLSPLDSIDGLVSLAVSAWYLDDTDAANLAFEKAKSVAESAGLLEKEHIGLISLFSSSGGFHAFRGEADLATENFEMGKKLFFSGGRGRDEPIGSVELFANASVHSYFQGNFDIALKDAEEAWRIATTHWDDNAYTRGVLASILAATQIELGDLNSARDKLLIGRQILSQLGDQHPRFVSFLYTEGLLELKSKNCNSAIQKFEQALTLADFAFEPTGLHSEQVGSLEGLVFASVCVGQFESLKPWFERTKSLSADAKPSHFGGYKDTQLHGAISIMAKIFGCEKLHQETFDWMNQGYDGGLRDEYFLTQWQSYFSQLKT